MADQEQLDLLKQGVNRWNRWRQKHPEIRPNLSEANLFSVNVINNELNDEMTASLIAARLYGAKTVGADLSEANFRDADLYRADLHDANLHDANLEHADLHDANLSGAKTRRASFSYADLRGADLSNAHLRDAHFNSANLSGANLSQANFRDADLRGTSLDGANFDGANFNGADLSGVDLHNADLSGVRLYGANLSGANLGSSYLNGADLRGTNLSGADLHDANLSNVMLIRTDLRGASLINCSIYGISVWNVQMEEAKQENLVITDDSEPTITVDNLKIAQFVYLLLDNEEIRDAINTLTMKAVLILGRFTSERKAILDALREELRKHNYLPILFDFEKPSNRNLTETVRTLAHLARFIIADLTDPSSIPQELQAIVPTLAVPIQPVLLEGKREYAMFVDLLRTYPWVLPIHYYIDQANLLVTLKEHVIEPAEQKAQELEKR